VVAGAVQTNYSLSFATVNSTESASPGVINKPFYDPLPSVTPFESGVPFVDGKDPITIPLSLTRSGTFNGSSAQTDYVIADIAASAATYASLNLNQASQRAVG
jgi:hypothetical protein